MLVLGIETTCDETAVAVVSSNREILSNVVLSQADQHACYGGVVPELAARAHLEHLDRIIAQALTEADRELGDLDGIAVASGPGLIGGLVVGLATAKALAAVCEIPLLAVNHLEGHALTVTLTDEVAFPYLLLLVSGGHCQLVIVQGVARYHRLGTTLDDAVGEAFDKAAQLLGLGYPGGPQIEQAAAKSTHQGRFTLPRPLLGRVSGRVPGRIPGRVLGPVEYSFSFSGLKTALRQLISHRSLVTADVYDLSAAFQDAVIDVLADRCEHGMKRFLELLSPPEPTLVAAGGVAANTALRTRLHALTFRMGFRLAVPPPALCTDNGAMIAWAGLEQLRLGNFAGLDCSPQPRWQL